jgi:nicotinamide-nucleotide amidase
MADNKVPDDKTLFELAARVGEALKAQGLMVATAESCTGGWIAQALTAVPGSSHWFERGFVTYTYISKREMLGVSQDTLGVHGAVSEQTVREMVAGALANSHAQIAVAVSGRAARPRNRSAPCVSPGASRTASRGARPGASRVTARRCAGSRSNMRWKACWICCLQCLY